MLPFAYRRQALLCARKVAHDVAEAWPVPVVIVPVMVLGPHGEEGTFYVGALRRALPLEARRRVLLDFLELGNQVPLEVCG